MADEYQLSPLYDTSPSKRPSPCKFLKRLNATSPQQSSNSIETLTVSALQPSRTYLHSMEPVGIEDGVSSLCHVGQTDICIVDADICASGKAIVPVECRSSGPLQKLKINSSFSLNAMHHVFMQFDSEKRAVMDSIGMGGLLKVHKQRLQCRDLLIWLLSIMDPNTGTIKLKTGELKMNDRYVNLVLGIPYTGQEITLGSRSPLAIEKVKESLSLPSDTDITIEAVEAILLKDYGRKMSRQERDAFKVAAILFVDSCFLGPRGCKRKINEDILDHVADPGNISKKNWSGYVISVLQQSASKVQQSLLVGNKCVLLEGCLLFLLVFYIDNLNFGYMTPRHDSLPRIGKYTQRLVSELIAFDRVRIGSSKTKGYGRCTLRSAEGTVYSRVNHAARNKTGSRTIVLSDQPSNASKADCYKSEEHLDHIKVHGHINLSEPHLVLLEHVNVFRSQIEQSTDEFERKVNILINTFHVAASSSSLHPTGTNVVEGESPILSKLGPKAPGRKHYMLVHSSSSCCGKSDGSSYCTEIQPQTVLIDSSAIQRGKACSASHTIPASHSFGCEPHLEPDLKFPAEDHVSNDGCHLKDYSGPDTSSNVFGTKDKTLPLKTILEVIRVLPKLSILDKNLDWFIHDTPTKLVIGGETMYRTFYEEEDFSVEIMNALMRVYQEIVDDIDKQCYENIQRHYLSPEWAEHALMDCNGRQEHDLAVTRHFPAKAASSSMVLAPVHNGFHWSLYSWDFDSDTLTILDPVCSSINKVEEKHDFSATQLHEAMLFCRQQFIGRSDALKKIWQRKYIVEEDRCFGNSGLYTVFYAKFFNGSACSCTMGSEDSATVFQTTLLVQLLGSMSNKGAYPQALREAMSK